MRLKFIRQTAGLMAIVLAFSASFGVQGVNVKALESEDNPSNSYVATEDREVEEPTIEEPTIEEPTIEEPTTEETMTEEPVTEETVTGETVTGEPTTEQPTTEQPTTEEPTTEEPTTVDYEIINDVYKVRQGVLIEYLGDKKDNTVEELIIPAVIQKIDANVFKECIYIRRISFESSSKLTEIGDYAFNECSALTEIVLPATVQKIGYRAFGKCLSLSEFTIPAKVTEGKQIFGTKNSVGKVTFAKGMSVIPEEILKYAYSVKSIVINTGVKTISKQAFYNCTALTSVSMPDTVTTIKSSAFNGCTSLSKVTLSSNLKSIGTNAFKNCTNLKKLKVWKSVTSIGDNAFVGDTDIVLQVYANSTAKAYARKNNIKWEYTSSEVKRRAANTAIYNKYTSLISSKNKSKYKLKYLKNYVPQGTCVIGKYVVVSMYHKNLKKNSILLVYDNSTGKYIKKVVLPSKDHVGAITNVEGRLVVSLNNISATDYVAVISYSKLKKIKSGKKIKYDYRVKLPGYADFAAYDGTYFWAGRSDNVDNAKMDGYKVKIKNKKLTFTKKYTYTVPKNTQGLIVQKGKGKKRTFILAQSYGRLNNSTLYTYTINLNKAKSLGTPKTQKTLPSMLEGIAMGSKNYIFMVFESGAGLYCGDPDNTSEIQVNNVCKLKYSNLSKMT